MTMRRLVTGDERRARMARRHRLAEGERIDDPAAIAGDLVALHSSDPATVHLSVLVRMIEADVTAVERALYDDRTLVRHHAMRRTIWVMTPATARRAHAAATLPIAERERTRTLAAIEASGIVDAAGWYDAAAREVDELLRGEGPLTTRQIGRALPHLVTPIVLGAGTRNPATVNAHTKILQGEAFRGVLVRTAPTGSWISSEYRWALAADWLGQPLDGADPRTAAAELCGHWLRRFGPAQEVDVRWWFGWTAKTARTALGDAGAVPVDLDGGGAGWLLADDLEPVPEPDPWVRLLPGLDATPMGWKERDWYLDRAVVPHLFDRFGNAGPLVMADGRVVGGWIQRPDGEIAVDLTTTLGAEHRALLDQACAELAAALGSTVVSPRFPAPCQRALLASR